MVETLAINRLEMSGLMILWATQNGAGLILESIILPQEYIILPVFAELAQRMV